MQVSSWAKGTSEYSKHNMVRKKNKREPTTRMKLAAKYLLENHGKSVSKAMSKAGYSKATSKNPKNVTKSKTWKELMDEFLPETMVIKKHKQLMNASKLDLFVFPLSMNDDQIKELVESIPGCVLKKIEHGDTQNRAYYWVPDNKAQESAVDMAYKLRGTYKATEVKVTGLEKYKALPQDQLEAIINGTSR